MKDFILTTVASYIIPFIQLYGLYLTFHGHDSPGGGFAGGIIIGMGFLLYFIAFSPDPNDIRLPDLGVVSGLIVIATLLSLYFFGDGFEIGIGFKVALVIVGIYYTIVREV